MDLELLRAFVTVVEAGGITSAARSLNRTQSAVSLQIKRLEERLDSQLFERKGRRVLLSEAGGSFLPYARRMLHLQEEARKAVGRTSRNSILRLGLPDEQALAYLADLLGPFARTYPEVQLSIHCSPSDQLVQLLTDGLLDLVLAIRHGFASSGEHVASQPLVWVAAQDFALEPKAPLPLAVHAEGCPYRAEAIAQLTRLGRDWQIVFTSQSPTGINLALRAGLGVSVKASRSVPEGCRVLGEAEALPPLRPAVIELHRNPATQSLASEALAQQLITAVQKRKATAL